MYNPYKLKSSFKKGEIQNAEKFLHSLIRQYKDELNLSVEYEIMKLLILCTSFEWH